ncbi:MAG: S-adenosylmethionine decarboxylase [Chloroflexi bacterium]|nr:S-adenosylmethionine decarboxylase [Chloroflexota bacterium]
MHLAIDGYTSDPKRLEDPKFVHLFLDSYPEAMGMTKISGPHVVTYRGPKPQDWGVSGIVIIAESHISVHTFPDRAFVNIDIFSCLDFDTDKALKEVEKVFTLRRVKTWTLERGLEHYDEEYAHQALAAERSRLASER